MGVLVSRSSRHRHDLCIITAVGSVRQRARSEVLRVRESLYGGRHNNGIRSHGGQLSKSREQAYHDVCETVQRHLFESVWVFEGDMGRWQLGW